MPEENSFSVHEVSCHKALVLLLAIKDSHDPKLWNLIVDFASENKLDLPIAVREPTLDDFLGTGEPAKRVVTAVSEAFPLDEPGFYTNTKL